MTEDDLGQPIILQDAVDVLTVLTIELVAHGTLTGRAADHALEEIANRILDYSQATTNPRAATVLGALATSLIQTEAGAG